MCSINRQILDYLGISDSPWGREPFEITDFICHSCGSGSKGAAKRWLNSVSDRERDQLGLVDVLMLPQPMMDDEIDALAEENEADERGEEAE